MIIAPSILNANKDNLDSLLKEFEEIGIIYLHLDIMDGKFVPNTTEGVEMQKKVSNYNFVFDTHLMVENPVDYAKKFAKAGSDIITFHYEAVTNPSKVIEEIKALGVKVGISIKPNTTVSEILKCLPLVDQVLVMSVEPGFGGQKFMESSLDKVKELSELRNKFNYDYQIEVDGGINLDNALLLSTAGANILVMGTFFINNDNRLEVVEKVNEM